MSWKLSHRVGDKDCGSGVRKGVLRAFADFADEEGGQMFASISALARRSGFGLTSVHECLRAFEDEGQIRRVGRKKCQGGFTTIYEMDLATLEALPDAEPIRRAKTFAAETPPPGGDLIAGGTYTPREDLPPKGVRHAEATPPPGGDDSVLNESAVVVVGDQEKKCSNGVWASRLAHMRQHYADVLDLGAKATSTPVALRNACEPAKGEACNWEDDVLPAFEELANSFRRRHDRMRAFTLPLRRAIELRDSRLAGNPRVAQATAATPAPTARNFERERVLASMKSDERQLHANLIAAGLEDAALDLERAFLVAGYDAPGTRARAVNAARVVLENKNPDWERRLDAWFEYGEWRWGPNPDQPGCTAPPEMIKRLRAKYSQPMNGDANAAAEP